MGSSFGTVLVGGLILSGAALIVFDVIEGHTTLGLCFLSMGILGLITLIAYLYEEFKKAACMKLIEDVYGALPADTPD
ncbi:MAG: hypothetical protein WC343_15725 [Bacilli bacterium]|jgi:membrane-bound ClpP family serine protease